MQLARSLGNRNLLLIIALSVIAIVAVITILTDYRDLSYKPGTDAKRDFAVTYAKKIYKTSLEQGMDMSNGPCLTNNLFDDWVVDVVNNPKNELDDLPENKCSDYESGKRKHIVELDTKGSVVKVK